VRRSASGLATQIGSGLVGVLYVLDEPSIGLHQRDNTRLIETLFRLRDMGNTLIVVEHDEDTIKVADWIVDIGPGAGEHGGEIVVSGSLDGPDASERSLTGPYLSGRKAIEIPKERREPTPGASWWSRAPASTTSRASTSRSRSGVLVASRGLRLGQVQPGQRHPLHDAGQRAEPRAHGAGPAPDDHRPRAPRQGRARRPVADRPHPAVQPGHVHRCVGPRPQALRQHDRGEDARLPARAASRSTSRAAAARPCSGDGTLKIEMNFLPDVYVPCEVCKGARFNRETLEVHYKGRTVAEVLDMPIEEAGRLLRRHPGDRPLPAHAHRGRAWATSGLGQPATTLSGGEAQRVKLASELQKRSNGRSIYVLDEPTTGLHFEDIRKLLLGACRGLVDKGNSVIVIEHNLDVIKSADWLIDMGPEGGLPRRHRSSRGAAGVRRHRAGEPHRPLPGEDPRPGRGRGGRAEEAGAQEGQLIPA
jgi:excinuclease ABC subunit A